MSCVTAVDVVIIPVNSGHLCEAGHNLSTVDGCDMSGLWQGRPCSIPEDITNMQNMKGWHEY